MELREQCAREALRRIRSGMSIGLGCGRTVAVLAKLIADAGLSVRVVTPSAGTAALCAELGLPVLPAMLADSLAVAFDGCDEVDRALNALKSGGGAHTGQKIVASMAGEYILMADEGKAFDTLPFKHPVVLEVIPEAKGYVERRVREMGGAPAWRAGAEKDGFTVSDHGNYLLDVRMAPPEDPKALGDALVRIPGVVETSLFCGVASLALVAGPEGVRAITRG